MRVNQSNSNPVATTETQKGAKAEKTAKATESKSLGKFESVPSEGSARTEISAKAKEFSKAKAVASAAPDVREDRIAELKAKIGSGQYKIDTDEIADRMFEEHSRLG